MTTNTLLPVGKAVYLEFCKSNLTTQILITPEGYSAESTTKPIPVSMYRRRISTSHKRRVWRCVAGAIPYSVAAAATPASWATVISGTGGAAKGDNPDLCNVILVPLVDGILGAMADNSWKLHIAPIVVDVTADDLTAVMLAKTPYKILGRVWKSRIAMGFPKEFFQSTI